jgi:RimJ/RimL family protein N-acetyltransferase
MDAPSLPFVFTEPVVTSRLVLRLMTSADVDDVHAYQSREDVARYQLFEPRSRAEVAAKVDELAAATTLAHDGDFLQLALELPASTGTRGRVIGDSFFHLASVENSRAEIGWTLHPDFMGLGYASEAAAAVLTMAFERLRLHRVYAELDPRNDASIRLCRRLGMREEAYFVADMWFKGGWADTGLYAILDTEWRARTGRT